MIITKAKLIENGVLLNDTVTLPNGNMGHIRKSYDTWLKEGNTPEPYFTQEELDNIKVNEERRWRDKELSWADIELNKIQDGYTSGTVKEYRQYRNDLRNYPDSENFPYGSRPDRPQESII